MKMVQFLGSFKLWNCFFFLSNFYYFQNQFLFCGPVRMLSSLRIYVIYVALISKYIGQIRQHKFHSFPCAISFFFWHSRGTRVFQTPPNPLMSKRRNEELKDDTQATAKRIRKPTGFRMARPPAAENASRSARASLSTSTSSRITTLVVGNNGRLGGRRKDKNHLISKYPPNQVLQSLSPLILLLH